MTPGLTQAARSAALRDQLGIPRDAERVLVLSESSHWDPNWLLTSDEYFRARVERIIDQALHALRSEPTRVFSVESVFFLQLYARRRPERVALLSELLESGRLRLIGGAISSPDTLVTPLEGLLRDYLLGSQWLAELSVSRRPRAAYFPDNFGHSPCLPVVVNALAIEYVGLTRIDGMYFPGTDYRDASDYPRSGSSAQTLLKHERSLTFRWQVPGAKEILCHWNAFGYGQGDLLAHRGVTRWMGLPLARAERSPSHVAKQIGDLVERLSPLSRTPYLFCPIGFDFVSPIEDLSQLISVYNETAFKETKVFVVNAGLDDYLDLVSCHREELPVLALDPNPYWMGFYASRPALKRSHWDLVARACRVEANLALNPTSDANESTRRLSEVWNTVAFSNHHDFVTGTSPDRVYLKEQRPLLAAAERTLSEIEPQKAPASHVQSGPASDLVSRREGNLLWIDNGLIAIAFDEARGGTIREVRDVEEGTVLLAEGSHDLSVFEDSGGLWRMGHELRGGHLSLLTKASSAPARLECWRKEDAWVVRVRSELDGHEYVRSCRLERASRVLRLGALGDANDDRTITLDLQLPWSVRSASMGCAGGVVERPSLRHYDPTFWPAQRFVHLVDRRSGHGVALLPRGTASVGFQEHRLSMVVQRTARMERAMGIFPLLGFPAQGREHGPYHAELGLTFTRRGNFSENGLSALADAFAHDSELVAARHVHPAIHIDSPNVTASALKPACDGNGLILRLVCGASERPSLRLGLSGFQIVSAVRCDALERTLAPVEVHAGEVALRMQYAIETLRVHLKSD